MLHLKDPKKLFKSVIVPVGLATFGVALYQGVTARLAYKNMPQLEPPTGPQKGLEEWVGRIKEFKDGMIDKVVTLPEKATTKGNELKQKLKKMKDVYEISHDPHEGSVFTAGSPPENKTRSTVTTSSEDSFDSQMIQSLQQKLSANSSALPLTNHRINGKKVQLVVIGDSLVAGVGCLELKASPILPKLLANMLSYSLQSSVEWRSAGRIGATVRDLRRVILPALKEKIEREAKDRKEGEEEVSEIVFVVICGLNDWRTMFEHFPRGLGLVGFRLELQRLVDELKNFAASRGISKVRVILPHLPLTTLASDPDCALNVAPLSYIVWYLCYLWDLQKQSIEVDDLDEMTFSVKPPSLFSTYATPGKGNVSADGVHPSDQGYIWWSMHLAEAISMTYLEEDKEVVESKRDSKWVDAQ